MIVKTSPDEIQNYLTDASNFKGFCEAVYCPVNKEEISEILIEANKNKTPVTISGNGTGLAGGRVPLGGIVISTEKLNKIVEINEEEYYAVLEPGVTLADFQNLLKEKDLLYPPDPTEENCFIGATIATNASGEKTFKYGPTRDYVLELDVILADGDLLKLKRGDVKATNNKLELKTESGSIYKVDIPDCKMPDTKNTSGYFCKNDMDAIDLFIGSEGTLGVITKVKVKVIPHPKDVLSAVIFFDDEKDALNFINETREITFESRLNKSYNGIDALALEYFDKNSLKLLTDDYPQIPPESEAAVWFEQEIFKEEDSDGILEKWIELIARFNGNEEYTWFGFSDPDKRNLELFRHAVPSKVNEYLSKNNFKKLGTDAAVPDNNFEEFYFFSKEEIEKAGLKYIVFGHSGNSHVHFNMLPENQDEFEKGKEVYKKICKKAVELEGTISAEHGIGKIKTEYLLDMYGKENINKMFKIKKTLDPNLILGRGNIFTV